MLNARLNDLGGLVPRTPPDGPGTFAAAQPVSLGHGRLNLDSRIDGHHIKHWAHGGATDLNNMVLLCHRHHWSVHEGGWQLVGGDGLQVVAVAPVRAAGLRARAPDTTTAG
jgi:HNH endonuclease